MKNRLLRVLAGATLLTLPAATVLVAATALPAAANEGTVVANATPSWQTNGTVWSVAYANGAVYLAGDFTSVRPPGAAPGTGEVARRYMAAFDSNTGALLPFSHTFDVRPNVLVASPDGKRIYAGGKFSTVDGASRAYLAAFDTTVSGGPVIASWHPFTAGHITAMATSADKVYVAGNFTSAGSPSQTRTHLAAFTASTGGLLPWAPSTPDGTIWALASSPAGDKIYIGGSFSRLDNNATYHQLGAVDGTTGALLPFSAVSVMPPLTPTCTSVVKDLVVDSTTVYGAAEGTGGGCFDGTFAADISNGSLKWRNLCLGATQAVQVIGAWVYKGSHAHDCSRYGDPDGFPDIRTLGTTSPRHLLVTRADNGFLGPWYPNTNAGGAGGDNLGPRTMATDGHQLFVGGDFTAVNGAGQQGFVRFSTTPDTTRPHTPSTPAASAIGGGRVSIRVTPGYDLDDPDLLVRVYRDAGTTPIATLPDHVLWWRQPVVTFTDTGLAALSKHTYRADTIERFGTNKSSMSAASAAVTVS